MTITTMWLKFGTVGSGVAVGTWVGNGTGVAVVVIVADGCRVALGAGLGAAVFVPVVPTGRGAGVLTAPGWVGPAQAALSSARMISTAYNFGLRFNNNDRKCLAIGLLSTRIRLLEERRQPG